MGLQNLVKFGAMGLATDIFAGPMTGGQGMRLGAIAGLFAPDAQDMDNVYQGSNFSGLPMEFLGFPMMQGLFGNTQGGPRDPAAVKNEWPGWAKALAVGAGAMLMGANGGSFSFPLYTFAAGLTPYNSGGAIPLAWSSGLISNWGWSRGFIM